jgi:hypothetical protein
MVQTQDGTLAALRGRRATGDGTAAVAGGILHTCWLPLLQVFQHARACKALQQCCSVSLLCACLLAGWLACLQCAASTVCNASEERRDALPDVT